MKIAMLFAAIGTTKGFLCTTRMTSRRHMVSCAATLDARMMEMMTRRVEELNNMADSEGQLVPLVVDKRVCGQVHKSFVSKLRTLRCGTFQISQEAVTLSPELERSDEAARTAAVAEAMRSLKEAGELTGWRDELLEVNTGWGEPPSFLVERAAYHSGFGIRGYGVHVNGYVSEAPGGTPTAMWVARRAATKATWPSMLDHLCAGQQPAGISPRANVIKEAGEEAGVPPELAAAARSVGIVSYRGIDEGGCFSNDAIFCYDMELPPSFVPDAKDGEVESFELWSLERVAQAVAAPVSLFKPNCNLVIIDFLVRHGWLTPESPGYFQLTDGLRQK